MLEHIKNLTAQHVFKNHYLRRAVVAHTFNSSTQGQKQADLCEFEASLAYRVSSRTGSKVTEKPCLKKTKTKQTKITKEHRLADYKVTKLN